MTERASEGQPPAEWRTSASEPYEVDWIDLGGVDTLADAPGALGMAFAPGQYDEHGRIERELDADLRRLRDEHRVDAVLLLLDDAELDALRLADLPRAAGDTGIELLRYPIPDFGVPEDPLTFGEVLDDLLERVRRGERVVIACRGGMGRTGTVAGCVLRQADVDPEEAVALVRATRPGTIERESQQAFVEAWNAL